MRTYQVYLVCDGERLPEAQLQLDEAHVYPQASTRGVAPEQILAEQIRGQLVRHYLLLASEQELRRAAEQLLQLGHNRKAPLSVGRLEAPARPGQATEALLRELTQKYETCRQSRISEWDAWRKKEQRFEQTLREQQTTLTTAEVRTDQLAVELGSFKAELGRLRDADAELGRARARITRLEQQEAVYKQELERLLSDLDAAEGEIQALRGQAQQFAVQIQALESRLQQSQAQLMALREPLDHFEQAQYSLLSAEYEVATNATGTITLDLTRELRAHLAAPGAVQLEVLYHLVRLQAGVPFGKLEISPQLRQALAAFRKRG